MSEIDEHSPEYGKNFTSFQPSLPSDGDPMLRVRPEAMRTVRTGELVGRIAVPAATDQSTPDFGGDDTELFRRTVLGLDAQDALIELGEA